MPGAFLPLLLLALAAGCGADSPARGGGCGTAATAAPAAALPELTGRVVDGAGLFAPAAEAEMSAASAALERQTSDQLVIVTTPNLAGEPIEAFGRRLGNGWGIGQEALDNGVLLIIAPGERRVRIEVGCGLEGLLTDARAGEIIEEARPLLAAGRYEEAARAAVAEIGRSLAADPRRPAPLPAKQAA